MHTKFKFSPLNQRILSWRGVFIVYVNKMLFFEITISKILAAHLRHQKQFWDNELSKLVYNRPSWKTNRRTWKVRTVCISKQAVLHAGKKSAFPGLHRVKKRKWADMNSSWVSPLRRSPPLPPSPHKYKSINPACQPRSNDVFPRKLESV